MPTPRCSQTQQFVSQTLSWNNLVGVVGKFAKLTASSQNLQVTCSHAASPMAEPCTMLAVMVFSVDISTLYTVEVPCEEVNQPVKDLVWKVELCQFIHQSSVPDCVKCFAEVSGDDDDIWVGD
jgi:hypothetical protein